MSFESNNLGGRIRDKVTTFELHSAEASLSNSKQTDSRFDPPKISTKWSRGSNSRSQLYGKCL
jgi:hypothetical protein